MCACSVRTMINAGNRSQTHRFCPFQGRRCIARELMEMGGEMGGYHEILGLSDPKCPQTRSTNGRFYAARWCPEDLRALLQSNYSARHQVDDDAPSAAHVNFTGETTCCVSSFIGARLCAVASSHASAMVCVLRLV